MKFALSLIVLGSNVQRGNNQIYWQEWKELSCLLILAPNIGIGADTITINIISDSLNTLVKV